MNRYRLTFDPAAGRVGWYAELLDDKNTVIRTSTDNRGPLSKLGLEQLGAGDEATAVRLVEGLEPMQRLLTADQQALQDAVDARKLAVAARDRARAADSDLARITAEAEAKVTAARAIAEDAHADAERADARATALEAKLPVDPDLDVVSDPLAPLRPVK